MVFPNPSTGLFEIPPHLTQQNFELLDARGKLLLNGALSEKLDLSSFPSGVYWLNVAQNQFRLLKN